MKNNILFVVPARLGDAIMLTPALAYLKKLCPAFNIDVLTFSNLAAEVFASNPNCNQHFLYSDMSCNDVFFKQYAFMVVCHKDKNAMNLIQQASCPVVANYGIAWETHQAIQNLDLIHNTIAQLSDSTLTNHYAKIKAEAHYEVFQPSTSNGTVLPDLSMSPYIVLHLGCHGLSKSKKWWSWSTKPTHAKAWPVKNYIAFANLLTHSHPELKIVLTGGETERLLTDIFLKECRHAINLVGATNVHQLATVIQGAKLFLSGDTGSMHVACATQTPLIALFANTNSVRTGPYPPEPFRKVVQADRIENISPEHVYKLATALLANKINDR